MHGVASLHSTLFFVRLMFVLLPRTKSSHVLDPSAPLSRSIQKYRFPSSLFKMSFGVGVGDIIALINLVKKVHDALRSTAGAGAQFRGITQQFSNLETALLRFRSWRWTNRFNHSCFLSGSWPHNVRTRSRTLGRRCRSINLTWIKEVQAQRSKRG